MKTYAKIVAGAVSAYPYYAEQLRSENKNTSFPDTLTDSLLSDWGVFPVTIPEKPSYDFLTQNVEQTEPVLVDGEWSVDWAVIETPLEIAERNVRNHRNDLLSFCDWTQVADAPVDQAAWATYRQELRDITTQAGFPYSVVWPVAPTQ